MDTVLVFVIIGLLSLFWGIHIPPWSLEAFLFGVVMMGVLYFFDGVKTLRIKDQERQREDAAYEAHKVADAPALTAFHAEAAHRDAELDSLERELGLTGDPP